MISRDVLVRARCQITVVLGRRHCQRGRASRSVTYWNPLDSHPGGNSCLRKVIGKAQVSFDELVTALAEIESIINSRPLTYLSAGDMEEPLTPPHLIVGRRIHNLPDHLSHRDDLKDKEFSLNSTQLTRRMKYLANVLNHFWNRWRNEYLSELREAHSYTARKQSKAKYPAASVGDIVVVHDERLPRGLWKLGRIVSVMKGRDDLIRGATVKIGVTDGQSILLNRPIQLLYPLEVRSQEKPEQDDKEKTTAHEPRDDPVDTGMEENECGELKPNDDHAEEPTEQATSELLRRSKRAAAKRADVQRKACMFELEDI